jgi:hypothetical protein
MLNHYILSGARFIYAEAKKWVPRMTRVNHALDYVNIIKKTMDAR